MQRKEKIKVYLFVLVFITGIIIWHVLENVIEERQIVWIEETLEIDGYELVSLDRVKERYVIRGEYRGVGRGKTNRLYVLHYRDTETKEQKEGVFRGYSSLSTEPDRNEWDERKENKIFYEEDLKQLESEHKQR